LEACSKAEVKNLVFASSSAVYGEAKTLPISEKEQLDPLSPYGASKIAGEALVSSFRNTGKNSKCCLHSKYMFLEKNRAFLV